MKVLKIIGSLSLLLFFSGAAIAQERPNIVLIMADDMGYSDLGCYGSEIPTPNIDELARQGVKFTQFYNTARCCPTRASLLTGLFPHQTGIGHMTEVPANTTSANWGTPGYQGYLNKNCVTMAEVLKSGGYHTYMTGKWHLGMNGEEKWPLQRGFEKYYGILAGAASYFKPQGARGLTYNNTPLPPPEGSYYTTDAFTDSAITFINSQNDSNPFFLYLAFNAPHWPLHAKPEDIKKFEGVYEKGWDEIRNKRYEKQLKLGIIDPKTLLSARDPLVRAWKDLDFNEQKNSAYRMAVYAAQISSIDQNVGKLIDALKQEGKFENTLVVFLIDNGACAEPYEELGGGALSDINNPAVSGSVSYGMGWANASNTPFRKYKREVEEGGIATPFIAHWPKGIRKSQQNKIINTPSYLIDVMPTFLGITKTQYPLMFNNFKIFPLEGRSLEPAFKGKRLTNHNYMYWEHEENEAIRKGNWKAVKDGTEKEWELFDLSKDPAEINNISSQHPEIMKELLAKWNEWAGSHFVFPKRKTETP